MNGPPKEVCRLPNHQEPATTNTISSLHATDNSQSRAVGRQTVFDTLAAIHRRPYRHSTGLRASGYREAWAAALLWFQREFDEHLDPIGKARLAAVVARSEAA